MKELEKELLLNSIETKIGIIKSFHKKEGADLIELYNDYKKNGTSYMEAKLFENDLIEFLGGLWKL